LTAAHCAAPDHTSVISLYFGAYQSIQASGISRIISVKINLKNVYKNFNPLKIKFTYAHINKAP
jgi:hypothetical protein